MSLLKRTKRLKFALLSAFSLLALPFSGASAQGVVGAVVNGNPLRVSNQNIFYGNINTLAADGDLLLLQKQYSTRFRISHDGTVYAPGNVGIGVASPGVKLDIDGGTGAALRIVGGGDFVINSQVSGSNATLYNDTGTLMSSVPFNAPQVCINGTCQSSWGSVASQWVTSGSNIYYNSGNVGIGTTNPGSYRVYGVTNSGSDWGYRFDNTANGSNVHMVHGGGYGLHVNGGTNASAGTYLLELYSANGINNNSKLQVLGNGNIVVNGSTVIDGNAGWHRTYGDTGWYNGTYGGGWYMADSSWIRSYGDKNIYQNTGVLRTDGTLQVGPSGNYFTATNGGNVGIRNSSPSYNLDVAGNMRTTGRYYSNEWIQMDNHTGLYSPNNGAHFYPNNGSYGSWRVAGNRNGWYGLEFDTAAGQTSFMVGHTSQGWGSQTTGVHNNSYGWLWRFDHNRLYADGGADFGGGSVYTTGSVGVGTNSVCPTCTKMQVQGATTGITVYGNLWGVQAWGGANGAALQANNSSANGNGININATGNGAYDIYSQGARSFFAGRVEFGNTIYADDFGGAGLQNIVVGDDTYLTDIDTANTLGVYGNQNSSIGSIRLGSSGATVTGNSDGSFTLSANRPQLFKWSNNSGDTGIGFTYDNGMISRIYATNNAYSSPPRLLLGVENNTSLVDIVEDQVSVSNSFFVDGAVGVGIGPGFMCPTCTKMQIEAGTAADALTAVGNLYGIQASANRDGGAGVQSMSSASGGYDFYGMGPMTHFSGNVGIGGTNPSYKLEVYDNRTGDAPAIFGKHSGVQPNYGIGVWGEGGWIGVRGEALSDGWTDFYAGGRGNYSPFTGSHDARVDKREVDKVEVGMLMITTGDSVKRPDNISTTLPKVSLSSKEKDARVIGVLVSKGKHKLDWYDLRDNEELVSVNALGEGVMWVTNYGGEIKNGDLITTSNIPGYGMLQDDDLMHSYTAGKCTQDIDWGSVTDTVVFQGEVYKKALVTVTYHAG
jgi:hypothetical protein